MSPWNGVTLPDLNNFMLDYPSGVIVQEEFTWGTLYDDMRADIKKDPHNGNLVDILIETGQPHTAKGHGEGADIPYPEDLGFVKMQIPLREVIVNAGISKQALDNATGGSSSWGRAVDRVLQAQKRDFLYLCEYNAFGDGTGRMARVKGAANNGVTSTITCDNTYIDFGCENVHLLRKNLTIEIYSAAGVKRNLNGVGYAKIVAVTKGHRNNGQPVDGTFTFLSAGVDAVADGDVVYLYGSKSDGLGNDSKYAPYGSLPMGLMGLIQDGAYYTDGATDVSLATFQGLVRANYPTLRSLMLDATDFVPNGVGVAGTPDDWDLSTISDAVQQVWEDCGSQVNAFYCSTQLAMAMGRKNRSENGVNVVVSNTGAVNMPAIGSRIATAFITADGREIPIKTQRTIPRNVLYGVTLDDLQWYAKDDFDFLRLTGNVWDKSYADRKTNFEAPFGGYTQMGARRCDGGFVLMDLRDDA